MIRYIIVLELVGKLIPRIVERCEQIRGMMAKINQINS